MVEKHNIPPVFDSDSRILILGSFPSTASREGRFFYHHRQNRFWKVMEAIFGCRLETVEDKRSFLLSEHIALWDVVASCDIEGSSDSSIKGIVANDLSLILDRADIDTVFTNGMKATGLFIRYCQPSLGISPVPLPSTSPANASWSLDRLVEAWSVVKDALRA